MVLTKCSCIRDEREKEYQCRCGEFLWNCTTAWTSSSICERIKIIHSICILRQSKLSHIHGSYWNCLFVSELHFDRILFKICARAWLLHSNSLKYWRYSQVKFIPFLVFFFVCEVFISQVFFQFRSFSLFLLYSFYLSCTRFFCRCTFCVTSKKNELYSTFLR